MHFLVLLRSEIVLPEIVLPKTSMSRRVPIQVHPVRKLMWESAKSFGAKSFCSHVVLDRIIRDRMIVLDAENVENRYPSRCHPSLQSRQARGRVVPMILPVSRRSQPLNFGTNGGRDVRRYLCRKSFCPKLSCPKQPSHPHSSQTEAWRRCIDFFWGVLLRSEIVLP